MAYRTNNQSIRAVKYSNDDITEIYKKFLEIKENPNLKNNVLVIKNDNGYRYIVKDIEKSTENYFPEKINDEFKISPPSYLIVYYYDGEDFDIKGINSTLEEIANGKDVEPSVTYLPYNQYNKTYRDFKENPIKILVNHEKEHLRRYEISNNHAKKYENGLFINDYEKRHDDIKEYLRRQKENRPRSPPKIYRDKQIANMNQANIDSENSVKKGNIKRTIENAAILIAAFLALYYMTRQTKGGGVEISNLQSELSGMNKQQLEDFIKELIPEVNKNDLNAEISKRPESEQNAVKEVASKYFPGFTFETKDETVFGNLFGDEDKKEGGKRKRTNKKRRTNKRRNNKKKSNRRYTDKV